MECEFCGYWYKNEDDEQPHCHYEDPWPAPCEEEPMDVDDEMGFDPYEGCYTYDC